MKSLFKSVQEILKHDPNKIINFYTYVWGENCGRGDDCSSKAKHIIANCIQFNKFAYNFHHEGCEKKRDIILKWLESNGYEDIYIPYHK